MVTKTKVICPCIEEGGGVFMLMTKLEPGVNRPETNYNFTTLMGLVSARLVHPEIPGRKLMIYD